jgi:serine/threonine protein kinase
MQIGEYRIDDILGAGAMGKVYRVCHMRTGRVSALKQMAPGYFDLDSIARFWREANIGHLPRHDNVVSMEFAGVYADAPYLVMEYVQGEALNDIMKRGFRPDNNPGWRDQDSALDLLAQVCDGLEHIHKHGIIHRDIKPANIMVTPNGTPKIADFGLVRSERDQRLTQSGEVIGTPIYMSLEQILGERDIDHRTDIYATGVMMYQALTDELPFNGTSFPVIALKVQTEEPTPPRQINPSISGSLDMIALKALAKDRGDRYESAKAFAKDLRTYLRGDQIAEYAAQQRKRKQVIGSLITGAVLTFGGASAAIATSILRSHENKQQIQQTIEASLREGHALLENQSYKEAEFKYGSASNLDPKNFAAREGVIVSRKCQRVADLQQTIDELVVKQDWSAAEAIRSQYIQIRDEIQSAHPGIIKESERLSTDLKIIEGYTTLNVSVAPGTRATAQRIILKDGILTRSEPTIVVGENTTILYGDWLISTSHTQYARTQYPVRLNHPTRDKPTVSREIVIPQTNTRNVPADCTYIPGGLATQYDVTYRQTQTQVRPFIIMNDEITVGQYQEFLSTQTPQDRLELRPRWNTASQTITYWSEEGTCDSSVPRDAPAIGLWVFNPDGSPGPIPRYTHWRSDRDGIDWRLPTQAEMNLLIGNGELDSTWPWGNQFESSRCNSMGTMNPNQRNRFNYVSPSNLRDGGAPLYGPVRDLSGSLLEWLSDKTTPKMSKLFGGSWQADALTCSNKVTSIYFVNSRPRAIAGFRLVRDLSENELR